MGRARRNGGLMVPVVAAPAGAGPDRDRAERLVRVVAKDVAARDVAVIELASADGQPLPAWTPGAHIDLDLPNGITRQYSLCGNPRQDSVWRLGVLRETSSRGGSLFIHERLQVGDELSARGPRNRFPLSAAERYLFIAGGIGITPLLPMLAEVHRAGADWSLAYGGRTRASMAFLGELTVYGDRVSVFPFDEVGMIDIAALLNRPEDGTLIYCCGPQGLLDAVETGTRNWTEGSLHVERFSSAPPVYAAVNQPFEVLFKQSGITLTVGPDETIVEAAENAGIPVMYSCAEGTCGTCESRVLEGTIDHRDSYLTGEERAAGDQMMICVSRSLGIRLVLDL